MVDTPEQHPQYRVPRDRFRPDHDEVWDRLGETGWCFAGEAAQILGITALNYRQIRAIYDLARWLTSEPRHREPKTPERRWSRYTARDLACAAEIVRLCVRPAEDSQTGRPRVNVAQLRNACKRLQREGLTNPLLEVHFEWAGTRLVAVANGVMFDAQTGQTLFAQIEARLKMQRGRRRIDPRLARVIHNERVALKKARERTLQLDRQPPRSADRAS